MIQDRYAEINGERVEFEHLKKNNVFSLFESDGELVGNYLATSDAYLEDQTGIWTIETDNV